MNLHLLSFIEPFNLHGKYYLKPKMTMKTNLSGNPHRIWNEVFHFKHNNLAARYGYQNNNMFIAIESSKISLMF